MIKVVLLGTGNVATHLFHAFSSSERIEVLQVYNRTASGLAGLTSQTSTTNSLNEIREADVYILALKDDALLETAGQLKDRKGLVAHTSGATALIDSGDIGRTGVFYPLQTFSKNKDLDYSQIPFCIEANNSEDLKLLKALANEISGISYEITSPQRKKLHLAAVFVCNFVNHLYSIGETICEENNIPFEILKPLIIETADKITDHSPREVQTGPAVRNDRSTINAHLELLEDPDNKKIYQLLTEAIHSLHGKKL